LHKLKNNYLLFSLTLFLASATCANAQYDTIKAVTVGNQYVVEENYEEDLPAVFHDYELPEYSSKECLSNKIYGLTKKFISKIIAEDLDKDLQEESDIEDEIKKDSDIEDEIKKDSDDVKVSDSKSNQDKEANVSEETVKEKNKFKISAQKISYNDDDGNVYANGNVEIYSAEQQVKLVADEVVLDKEAQLIKLIGNVKIIKDGVEMCGETMLVDLNEQNVLMDNPLVDAYSFEITAQEGYLIANDLQMLNGSVKSNRDMEYKFGTKRFMRYDNFAYDFSKADSTQSIGGLPTEPSRKPSYRIDAKEIILTSYRDHNSLTLKKADIYYNKKKLVNNSDIEIISDKKNEIAETNMPEIASFKGFGLYVGYGFVSKLPKGHTLKLLPAITHGDGNLGVGLLGRYRTQNGLLQAGYNTSTTNLIVKGKYRLSDSLTFNYGRQSYIPEGFYGARRSGYAGQFTYGKSYYNKDLKTRLNTAVYAGLFADYQDHDQEKAFSTTRFRYTAQLSKNFLKYENKEQDLNISLSGMVQAGATVYGTGDTTGLIKAGPVVTTRLKSWESSLGYLFGGIHGDSPFWFDKYMYGRSSIMLNEKFHLGRKLAVGYRATVSPLKDNYKDDLLTESRLYVVAGPEDLKVVFSYDVVRSAMYFDFMLLLGSESTKIDFEKLTTKDMDGGKNKQDFYKRVKTPAVESEDI